MINLFELINMHALPIRKAAEVGVLSFGASNLRSFIEQGVECHLYEAVPEFCDEIELAIRPHDRAFLHRGAVSDYNGVMTLCLAGPSTFNAELSSTPAINHDGVDKSSINAKFLEVSTRDFAELDPGDLDLISMDVEGGEYPVLSRMRSRPLVISIETQSRDYINPQLGAITDWMVREGYRVWLPNDTDTIFIRRYRPPMGLKLDFLTMCHRYRYFAGRL